MKKDYVSFKSEEPYYTKEKSGIKPHTEREVDMSEEKHQKLAHWAVLGKKGNYQNKYIQIFNTIGKPESFERQIKDITYWKNLVIISW